MFGKLGQFYVPFSLKGGMILRFNSSEKIQIPFQKEVIISTSFMPPPVWYFHGGKVKYVHICLSRWDKFCSKMAHSFYSEARWSLL